MTFPVTLGTMYGKLCAPAGANTVQVLIPGGTYNSSYWDIGFDPDSRSYREAMNNAGYATLAVDRLGTGRSSKPLSVLVTATAQAQAVHEVIRTLRPRFSKVIVGGHSIGSAMAMIEAGNYQDVDGVLVTGMTHRMNLITVIPVLANMIPAPLDPKLASRGIDLGYLTTSPGTRYNAFHVPGPLVDGAINFDESTKDVFAATEAVDTIALTNIVIPATRRIQVPVLIVLGNDKHFCGAPLGSDCSSAEALRQSEAPFFSPAAHLQTYILQGYGHAINYAPNAPEYHQVVVNWADSFTK
jgi:pimeloyl-ACP methyl ester carboxylesterase